MSYKQAEMVPTGAISQVKWMRREEVLYAFGVLLETEAAFNENVGETGIAERLSAEALELARHFADPEGPQDLGEDEAPR